MNNVVTFVGPTQISSCGHLSLDGSQSSGGGGRDLTYTWSNVGVPNAGISSVLIQANTAKVFINGTLMTAGTTYRIRLGRPLVILVGRRNHLVRVSLL